MSGSLTRLANVVLGMMMACGVVLPTVEAKSNNDRMRALDFSITLAEPTIMPASGNYTGSLTVTIEHKLPDVLLYYTLDGSEPSDASIAYAGPFRLYAGATVKARAYRKGHHGPVAKAVYVVAGGEKVATPTISPNGGEHSGSVKVLLATATAGADIFYTTDGSDVGRHGRRYTGALWLAGHTRLKAVAVKDGMSPSTPASAEFEVDFAAAAQTPTITPAGGSFNNSVKVTLAIPDAPPAPDPVPQPDPEPFVHIVEAESGTLTAPMAQMEKSGASANKVIATDTADQGTAVYTVTVAQAGDHYLWGRVFATAETSDTFGVKVDGGEEVLYNIADGAYPEGARWTRVKQDGAAYKVALTAGPHTITVTGKEAGSQLDSLLVTNDDEFAPTATMTAATNGSHTGGMMRATGMGAMTVPDSAEIHYTLDGTTPSPYDALYAGPLTISATATLKAAAFIPGQGYSNPAAAAYTITVTPTKLIATITDRETDKPVKGAMVAVTAGGREVIKGAAGDDGVANLEIPAGVFGDEQDTTVKVLVSADHYRAVGKQILIRRHIDNTIAVDLEPTGEPEKLVLAVTVLDEVTSKPIKGATVHASLKNGVGMGRTTDEMGVARFELPAAPATTLHEGDDHEHPQPSPQPTPAPALTVTLKITAKGYETLTKEHPIASGANAVTVKLKPFVGESVTKVTVTVQDELTKAAIAGADVSIQAGGGRAVKGKTDDKGVAVLTLTAGGQVQMMPDMAVKLHVQAKGYLPSKQDVGLKLGQPNAFTVGLKKLPAPGITKVLIKVTDDVSKQAIVAAQCKLKLARGREFQTISDGNGQCTLVIPDLGADTQALTKPAKLTVTATSYIAFVNEQVMLNAGVDNSIEVALKSNQIGQTKLTVTVTDDATKQPLMGALVLVESKGPGSPQRMFTDDQGKAVIVLPESHEDVAKAEREATLVVSLRSYQSHTQTLQLTRRQDNTAAVALKPGALPGVAKVIVTVTDAATKAPLVGAAAQLTLPEGRSVRTISDGSGIATLVVLDLAVSKDKPATLTVNLRGYGEFTKSLTLTPGQDHPVAAAMTPTTTNDIIKVTVTATSKATNQPVSGALVELIPDKEGMAVRGFTAMDGKVQLVLRVHEMLMAQAEPASKTVKMVVTARGFVRHVQEAVTVTQDKDNQVSAVLDPQPTGVISKVLVKVTKAGGPDAVAGASVELKLSDGKSLRSFSDATGVATLVILDPPQDAGKPDYKGKITVTAQTFETVVKENVTIPRGKDTTVDVALQPKS
jgi:hypothetical protein